MITHTIESYWIPSQRTTKTKLQIFKKLLKFQIDEFWEGHYTLHTFWSCLIRCANKKWIWRVFLKIQSGHDSVHRWTDGRTDKVIPVYPTFNFIEAGGIMMPLWQKCFQEYLHSNVTSPPSPCSHNTGIIEALSYSWILFYLYISSLSQSWVLLYIYITYIIYFELI